MLHEILTAPCTWWDLLPSSFSAFLRLETLPVVLSLLTMMCSRWMGEAIPAQAQHLRPKSVAKEEAHSTPCFSATRLLLIPAQAPVRTKEVVFWARHQLEQLRAARRRKQNSLTQPIFIPQVELKSDVNFSTLRLGMPLSKDRSAMR